MLLEVQVAFVVLGIGLAGLAPVVAMQIRQVRVLENRIQGNLRYPDPITGLYTTMYFVQEDPNTGTYNYPGLPMGQTYYLVRWTQPWAQKLFGAAQIVNSSPTNPCEPAPLTVQQGQTPTYDVNITTGTYTNQTVTVTAVLVQKTQ